MSHFKEKFFHLKHLLRIINKLTMFRKIIPSGQVTFKKDIANNEW